MTDFSPVDAQPVDFDRYLVRDVHSTSEWCNTFIDFLKNENIDSSAARLVAMEIIETYSDADRAYHGFLHLTTMWNEVIANAKLLNLSTEETVAQMLAVPAHDIVYDTTLGSPINEQRSATWARDAYADIGIPHAIVNRVDVLVVATASHNFDATDVGMCAFLDADIAILQTSWPIYERYAAGVIKEYVTGGVALLDYRTGRMAFLQAMLSRQQIFSGKVEAYSDDRARANLGTELALFDVSRHGLPFELTLR